MSKMWKSIVSERDSATDLSLVIVGASARAAAQSARRAGWDVWCADLFADADLAAIASTRLIEPYPHGLLSIVADAPAGPWMYTGALENHPNIVDQVAAGRHLYGNPGGVLRQVRNPFRVAAALRGAGLASPDCRPSSASVPCDGSWIYKRLRSAGGIHVRRWLGEPKSAGRDGYFQKYVEGTPCSAVFLAWAGRVCLMGATEQLLSGPGTSNPFKYLGSIGPLRLASETYARLTRIGEVIASQFGLAGLFGVDFVLAGEVPWPVEVNPRYTASCEILEWCYNASAVAWHVAACEGNDPSALNDWPAECRSPSAESAWHGKAILQAVSDTFIDESTSKRFLEQNRGLSWPVIADIPRPLTTIRLGQPVLTVFTEGRIREAVLQELRRRLDDAAGWLAKS